MTTYPNPGAIGDVVTATKIESTWGNAIRDRVVQHFASATDRDAAIPTPVAGQICWQDDITGVMQYDGVAWRLPWNMPWGQVARVASTTLNQSGISAVTDLTGMTVTWTAVANRFYKVSWKVGQLQGSSTSTTDVAEITLTDGAGTVVDSVENPCSANSSRNLQPTVSNVHVESGLAAGSVTRKLRLLRLLGSTISFNCAASASQPCELLVEDIGPNGAPA